MGTEHLCTSCFKIKPLEAFRPSTLTTNRSQCIECGNKVALAYYHRNSDKIRKKRRSRRSAVSGRAQYLLNSARTRAKKYGLPCTITTDWVIDKITQRCPLTGRTFDLTPKKRGTWGNPNAPSLDRINNSRGYTPGNTRVIVAHANYALNQFGTDAFVELCRDVIRTIPSQAPQGEGVTTIPQGSRAKRPEAHGTRKKRVMI